MKCPNCGGETFETELGVEAVSGAPGHNLLSLHDVRAIVYTYCVDCSETVKVFRDWNEAWEALR